MNHPPTPSLSEQQFWDKDEYYDPLPSAESANYEITHAALLDAARDGGSDIDLTQIRLSPDPASLFGQYCAEQVAALQTATPEPLTPTDASVSLQRMLSYNYGLSLPESTSAATVDDLRDKLAEMKASQGLGLLDEFDVDSLLSDADVRNIHQACAAFIGTQGGTLLGWLGNEIIVTRDLAQTRKAPISMIARIIRSDRAQVLARLILATLGWSQSQASPTLIDRLLWKAISLDLQAPQAQQPGFIAGYEIAQQENWARSCSAILADVHNHLVTTGKATTLNEAVLAASVLAFNDHPEWLVSDIPDNLPYGTTSVWANFHNGVGLAEAIAHGSSRWMSFKDLTQLPAVFSSKMNTEEQQIAYAATRVPAIVLWAQVNGHLRPQGDTPYTQQEIEQAITIFEQEEDQSIEAINALNTKPPERRAMAREAILQARRTPEIARLLEQQGYTLPPLPLHPSVMLVPKDYPDVYHDGRDPDDTVRHSFKDEPDTFYPVTRRAYTLLDIYMSGENIDDWRQPGTFSDEGLREVNTELRLLYNALPAMPGFFEQSFQSYMQNAHKAYATLIKKLLVRLPFKHRLAIENGEVTLYSLRLPTKDIMASKENESHREPLRGRKGFIIRVVYDGQTTYFEVFPQRMVIRHRADLNELAPGGTLVTEFWQMSDPTLPYPTSTYAGRNLPFDWDAYSKGDQPRQGKTGVLIAETIGATLKAPDMTAQPAPLTTVSQRCSTIASTIVTGLFYFNADHLHVQRKGMTEVELKNNRPGELERVWHKVKTLFWDPVEDLLSGEKARIQAGSLDVSLLLLPYGKPAGTLLSGSARLIFNAGKGVLARNAGSRTLNGSAGFLSRLAGAVKPDRALLGKAAKGVGQFVRNHMTWRFFAVRAGIAISRSLAAQARKLDAQPDVTRAPS